MITFENSRAGPSACNCAQSASASVCSEYVTTRQSSPSTALSTASRRALTILKVLSLIRLFLCATPSFPDFREDWIVYRLVKNRGLVEHLIG